MQPKIKSEIDGCFGVAMDINSPPSSTPKSSETPSLEQGKGKISKSPKVRQILIAQFGVEGYNLRRKALEKIEEREERLNSIAKIMGQTPTRLAEVKKRFISDSNGKPVRVLTPEQTRSKPKERAKRV